MPMEAVVYACGLQTTMREKRLRCTQLRQDRYHVLTDKMQSEYSSFINGRTRDVYLTSLYGAFSACNEVCQPLRRLQ